MTTHTHWTITCRFSFSSFSFLFLHVCGCNPFSVCNMFPLSPMRSPSDSRGRWVHRLKAGSARVRYSLTSILLSFRNISLLCIQWLKHFLWNNSDCGDIFSPQVVLQRSLTCEAKQRSSELYLHKVILMQFSVIPETPWRYAAPLAVYVMSLLRE